MDSDDIKRIQRDGVHAWMIEPVNEAKSAPQPPADEARALPSDEALGLYGLIVSSIAAGEPCGAEPIDAALAAARAEALEAAGWRFVVAALDAERERLRRKAVLSPQVAEQTMSVVHALGRAIGVCRWAMENSENASLSAAIRALRGET